jgi:hypothetical protein
MPTSLSRLSYSDCFDFFTEALADPKGICVSFAYDGDAYQLRTRLHTARVIDRKENAEIYPPNHPLFGRSEYDSLMVRLVKEEDGSAKVFIQPRDRSGVTVIRLSEVDEEAFQSEGSRPVRIISEQPNTEEVEPVVVERRD